MRLVVGIGLRVGTSCAELEGAVADLPGEVELIATLAGRETEPALQQLADELGAELRTFTEEELRKQAVPNPSDQVSRLKGIPSVAEAAVLAAGAELLVPKYKTRNATVAVGRLP